MNKDRIRVAFQGELGAYSELAAREFFKRDIDLLPCPTFNMVFESTQEGSCEYGMIPIENSLTGSIHQNYDMLMNYSLVIAGEIMLRISHNLIVNKGVRLKDVKKVYSHPQALSQCEDFIGSLKGAEALQVYDTAGAAKMIKEDRSTDAAAIASVQAAAGYDLEILKTGIESNQQNFTRFLVVSKEEIQDRHDPKTSIVFSIESVPGALFKSLGVFALRDVNLLKIESRPLKGKLWEYLFYLDFDGDVKDGRCSKALGHLKEIAGFVKVLGSYQKGRTVGSA